MPLSSFVWILFVFKDLSAGLCATASVGLISFHDSSPLYFVYKPIKTCGERSERLDNIINNSLLLLVNLEAGLNIRSALSGLLGAWIVEPLVILAG